MSPEQDGRAGRRRGAALEHAIFAAVVDQLETVGYAGLTMEGVAVAARTGKAALYRRWPSKADLVVDALDHALPAPEETPDLGNVRDDLLEHLRQKTAVLNSSVGRAVQSLLAEIHRDRPLVRLVQERVFAARENIFREILDRGTARGEIRPGAISPLVAEIGPAMLVRRFLGGPGPVEDAYLVEVVDALIMPLVRRP
ncbi:TetR/AcrR family transcriptional regulator [Streptomyces specialis]|uniref:TetR/AcrR family transcriptional regulator n=1 Tax=Streptomyces specialis TaxID=498367 RepID=UPI00073E33BF|nr:TetR/AcrR family transcriptional regulator [Streptomyces specialis]